MIYAKCIRDTQIAENKVDFIKRKCEENHVYCVGETTVAHGNHETLCSVPLNYIYDCLKYGTYIAIIETPHEIIDDTYPADESLGMVTVICKQQRVVSIRNAYSKETIDFVVDSVGNPDIIHDGYIHFLPDDLQAYFYQRKGVQPNS